MRIPTLLLGGGDSSPYLQEVNRALAEVLPNSHIAVMRGQGHQAVETGPGFFTVEVLRFLS